MSPSVGAALAQARALGLDRLDAQLLLAHVLQCPRAWLLAHDDAPLAATQAEAFAAACRRRVEGEPLAYLMGEREFHGLRLKVSPAVLIPRPDTETLVDWVLELLSAEFASEATPRLADLGTGSGAIALALKYRFPGADVCAVDLSGEAIEVARANAAALGLSIEFHRGDWLQPLTGRRFHLIASNPPYVAATDPHLTALRHEPLLALAGGADGMSALKRIARDAPAHLLRGGWLLLEHGCEQGDNVRDCLHSAGFDAVQTRNDLAGRARCSAGRWLSA